MLYFQPKVRLADGRAAGAEALIRWEHPSLGLVPPDEFIPLVEKTVLLRPLTHYVIETVLKQWREWADMGIRIPISINVSTSVAPGSRARPSRSPISSVSGTSRRPSCGWS